MPKQQSNSELLTEGCRSYNKALFAVMQFRREVQEAIRAVVDERIDDLAVALRLDKDELGTGLLAYADPASFGQSWDGSNAEIGFKYPSKPWQTKWGIYFYFWIADNEEGCAVASCWFKEPGTATNGLASLAAGGAETDGCAAWISEPVSEAAGGFHVAIGQVLDRWIELWRSVGGIKQFLPGANSGPARGGA
jgi:hypothetical protein